MKRMIFLGCLMGVVLTGAVHTGAMPANVAGDLTCKNPLLSAPKGKAHTIAPKGTVTAQCSASKNGTTNTKKISSSKKSSVETDWVSGPTMKASGTTFNSKHKGCNSKGVEQTLYASYSY